MRRTIAVLLLMLWIGLCYPIPPIGNTEKVSPVLSYSLQTSLQEADKLFKLQQYPKALDAYQNALISGSVDSTLLYRKIALCQAALGNAKEASANVEKYLLRDFNTSFLVSEGFTKIQNTSEFKEVVSNYTPKLNAWSFAYFYVALIGFYIAIVINFNKKIDRVAAILIGAFILIHSFFIFHIGLLITNYQYEFPHSYLMSTSFSFLYGPLLYFYFKRITQQYTFKKIDFLHLLPTLLFLIYIIPIYGLPADEKLSLMLDRVSEGYNPGDSTFLVTIVTLKLTSLITYGYFIRKIYLKGKQEKELSLKNRIWQRNIYAIHVAYIIAYAIYGTLISNHINSGFFYHAQIVCMSLMVIYVGYSANVQPQVFSGIFSFDNHLFFKYKKSGLTESLSNELKEQLINLFDNEKIYRENDISLELLATKLDTTRHNASQVINEHFKLSFHELINKYRIQEAKKILDSDYRKNLNIIDVAYEVGYNNKVTFNKAFKRDTHLTPSEYQKNYAKTRA